MYVFKLSGTKLVWLLLCRINVPIKKNFKSLFLYTKMTVSRLEQNKKNKKNNRMELKNHEPIINRNTQMPKNTIQNTKKNQTS